MTPPGRRLTTYCASDAHVIHIRNFVTVAGWEVIVVVKVIRAAGAGACATVVIIEVSIHKPVSSWAVQNLWPRVTAVTTTTAGWVDGAGSAAHAGRVLLLWWRIAWPALKTLATRTAIRSRATGLTAGGCSGLTAGWARDGVHFHWVRQWDAWSISWMGWLPWVLLWPGIPFV